MTTQPQPDYAWTPEGFPPAPAIDGERWYYPTDGKILNGDREINKHGEHATMEDRFFGIEVCKYNAAHTRKGQPPLTCVIRRVPAVEGNEITAHGRGMPRGAHPAFDDVAPATTPAPTIDSVMADITAINGGEYDHTKVPDRGGDHSVAGKMVVESPRKTVTIEIQDGDMEQAGAYLTGSAVDGKAVIKINFGAIVELASEEAKTDRAAAFRAYLADTLGHEVMHVCQELAGVAFSEDDIDRAVDSFNKCSLVGDPRRPGMETGGGGFSPDHSVAPTEKVPGPEFITADGKPAAEAAPGTPIFVKHVNLAAKVDELTAENTRLAGELESMTINRDTLLKRSMDGDLKIHELEAEIARLKQENADWRYLVMCDDHVKLAATLRTERDEARAEIARLTAPVDVAEFAGITQGEWPMRITWENLRPVITFSMSFLNGEFAALKSEAEANMRLMRAAPRLLRRVVELAARVKELETPIIIEDGVTGAIVWAVIPVGKGEVREATPEEIAAAKGGKA